MVTAVVHEVKRGAEPGTNDVVDPDSAEDGMSDPDNLDDQWNVLEDNVVEQIKNDKELNRAMEMLRSRERTK